MNRTTDDSLWPLIGLCAALAAVLTFTLLASALAGVLGSGSPIWIGPSQAGTLLARLVSRLSHPALAGLQRTGTGSRAPPSCRRCSSHR